jgi:hypothetical protein
LAVALAGRDEAGKDGLHLGRRQARLKTSAPVAV